MSFSHLGMPWEQSANETDWLAVFCGRYGTREERTHSLTHSAGVYNAQCCNQVLLGQAIHTNSEGCPHATVFVFETEDTLNLPD